MVIPAYHIPTQGLQSIFQIMEYCVPHENRHQRRVTSQVCLGELNFLCRKCIRQCLFISHKSWEPDALISVSSIKEKHNMFLFPSLLRATTLAHSWLGHTSKSNDKGHTLQPCTKCFATLGFSSYGFFSILGASQCTALLLHHYKMSQMLLVFS